MKRTVTGFGVLLILTAAATLAQTPPPPPGAVMMRSDIPPEGFWPTQRMMNLVIDRITEEMVGVYNFSDEQLEQTRGLLKERFPSWLQQNRAQIQPLVTQYVEALLDGEPPPPEAVAEWAARAQPLIEDFNGLLHQTADDMQTYMTDEQQLLLSGQLAAMDVGMNFMRQRLETWRQGGYDPEVDWPRSPGFRERQRERERQLDMQAQIAKDAAMGVAPSAGNENEVGPPKPLATKDPLDATATDDWTAYVEAFIRRYKLDDAQQNRARQLLRAKLEDRDKYLRAKAPDIAKLDDEARLAETDEQRTAMTTRLDTVRKPLERMFQELKDRLDRILTPSQKRAALKLEPLKGKTGNGGKSEKPATPAATEPAMPETENKGP